MPLLESISIRGGCCYTVTVQGGIFYYLLSDQFELLADRFHMLGHAVVGRRKAPCSRS